ncbi:MAG: hypothetical protein ACOC2W_03775 [bacterium]
MNVYYISDNYVIIASITIEDDSLKQVESSIYKLNNDYSTTNKIIPYYKFYKADIEALVQLDIDMWLKIVKELVINDNVCKNRPKNS